MKTNTKSSITLPPEELELVLELKTQLNAKSNVEVVRRGLRLLKEVTNREALRQAYKRDSLAVRASLEKEIAELDSLVAEGLEDW
ncbi:MAG: hypothetical protein WBP34_11180 [Thermoanaerobaculia bacterium]|jgi:hypothetical protein